MSLFQKISPDDLDLFDASWLEPIPGVKKVEFRSMMRKVKEGEWSVWRLQPPASGIAVAYPEDGKLFIYYLRGFKLFATLTKEDLLEAARLEGLSGCQAEASSKAMIILLKRIGFKPILKTEIGTLLELEDGR